MNLFYIKENYLTELKMNMDTLYPFYLKSDNTWIEERFKDNPFEVSNIEVKNFELFEFPLENRPNTWRNLQDYENVKRIHQSLKELPKAQLIDERLWVGLTHHHFWNYMVHRENVNRINSTTVLNHFFFRTNTKRDYIKNSLSKLFWIGNQVYDESREDPYELLDYLKDDFSTKSLIIFSNNYTNNPKITRALFSALLELQKEGFELKGELKREIYYKASYYLNFLGGFIILDYLEEEEIKFKIINYLKNLKE